MQPLGRLKGHLEGGGGLCVTERERVIQLTAQISFPMFHKPHVPLSHINAAPDGMPTLCTKYLDRSN